MGLENIALNNGWSQALLGISIVMTGLIILSIAISQIHKLVDFWENRPKKTKVAPEAVSSDMATTVDGLTLEVPNQCPADIGQVAALYQPIVEQLGTSFELRELYQDFYRGEPFIRIVSSLPQTKHTWGNNFCLIYPALDSRTGRLIVISCIDNLVKGAAGQAVQNMNLMLGLSEATGLGALAIYP